MTRFGWFVASCCLLGACAQPASRVSATAPSQPDLTATQAAEWVSVRHVVRPNTRAVILAVAEGERELQISAKTVEDASDARASIEALLTELGASPAKVEVSLNATQALAFHVVLESEGGESLSVPVPAGVAGAFIVTRQLPVTVRRGALLVHGVCAGCGASGEPNLKIRFSGGWRRGDRLTQVPESSFPAHRSSRNSRHG